MAHASFNGLRVLSLESRRAKEVEKLIRTYGGEPIVVPAMREVGLESNQHALEFASGILAGSYDLVIFMTGVGVRAMLEIVQTRFDGEELLTALRKVKIAARGEKPASVLRELKITTTSAYRWGRELPDGSRSTVNPWQIASAASKDPRFKAFKNIPEDFEAMLCTPILRAGRVVRVINLQHRMSYRHTTEQVRLLATLGFLVSAEIERARLESENTQLTGRLETRKAVDRAKSVLKRISPSTKKKLIKRCSERAGSDVNPCERLLTQSCWPRI